MEMLLLDRIDRPYGSPTAGIREQSCLALDLAWCALSSEGTERCKLEKERAP